MSVSSTIKILEKNNLRKTTIRKQVLSLFLNYDYALSNQFIEKELSPIDRVTLYRTLRTFEDKGVIHKALDGSDTIKYALCAEDCTHHFHKDNHIHFHCEICGNTLCLDDLETPKLPALKGFKVKNTYFVQVGICDKCNKKG